MLADLIEWGHSYALNTTEPAQLRGLQHDAASSDELAKWCYARKAWGMLQLGLRLGETPGNLSRLRRAITTDTQPPRASDGKSITVTRGTTFDNTENLVGNLVETMVKQYVGTQLGRQELNAELIDDVAGALWTRRSLELCRLADEKRLPPVQRIVITIDPAAKASN